MRVYELAKDLNLTSKEMIEMLKNLGHDIKSAQSSIPEKAIDHIKKETKLALEKKEKEAAVKKAIRAKKQESIEAETLESEEEVVVSMEEEEKEKREILEVSKGITVKDFAAKLEHPPADIIKMLMSLGEMITINQSMSDEAINIVGEEFGYEVHIKGEAIPELIEIEEVADKPEDMTHRPPIVTIMGHVNHGKTALLDAIRETDVVSEEAGGITQHIGAYQITHNGKKITFIDTPGHEAFTAMRARGTKVTDIAILVVAADDGVMPQTIEALDHARAAQVPIIVTINKIDKPGCDPDRIKKQLVEHEVVPEEWGGETIFVDVSAKQITNIDELLEMILLVAELNEFMGNEKVPAKGTVIEAELDKTRGPKATVLINRGILKLGDIVVAGSSYGRNKAMSNDHGNKIDKAYPSQPVEILGLSTVPEAGDIAQVVKSEKVAKEIVEKRIALQRDNELKKSHVTLDNLFDQIKQGEVKDLNIIIKADVQGSVEALKESLAKIDQEEVRINIVHSTVGGIKQTDIMLAAASDAIVVGFNVRPDIKARDMAKKEQVDVKLYNVIYRIIDDIEAARKGMLSPEIIEKDTGRARVQRLFKASKIGTIAGCIIEEGEIKRSSNIRIVREGVVINEGKIKSLRRFKDDVSSITQGLECGILIENFNDVKVDDILEAYSIEEKPRE